MTAPKTWRRSSACSNAACVEVAIGDDQVLVRNNTNPDTVLTVDAAAWRAFIAGLKDRP